MAIEIRQEQEGPFKVLALSGRLDTETAVDVELALQDLLGAGERQFIIDLAGIGYVSSAGLRVLLSLAKQLDGGKGTLRLCALNASVKQVFDVAGFSKLFTIFPDRAGATKSLPSSATQAFKAAQAAQAGPPKPEAILAQKAAVLMGIPVKPPVAYPQGAELARSAALLLGVKPAPAAGAAPAPKAAAAPRPAPAAKPAAAPKPAAAAPAKQGGVLDKLRGLFGGKR
jgi:anti-anti-sigma factor